MRRDDPIDRAAPEPRGMQALDPYVTRLARIEADGPEGARDQPARVRIGGRSLTLDPWERAQLRAVSARHGGGDDGAAGVVARTVAVLAKSLVDIERFNRSEHRADGGFYELQAELMLDTAIGAELLGRTQRLVEGRIAAGRVDEAKRVSDLHNRLRRSMGEVQRLIAESEQSLARKIGEPARQATAVAETLDHLSRRVEEQRRVKPSARERAAHDKQFRAALERLADSAPEPAPVLPGRATARRALTVLLGLTLVVMTVVHRVSSFLPDPARSDLTTVLATPDIDPFAIIEQLRSRRPSLFVTVREVEWRALSEADRAEAVDRIASLASARGYTGVLLRTERRRPVAQWLSVTGPRLIEAGEGEQGTSGSSDPRS